MKNHPIDKATISQIDSQTALGAILDDLLPYIIPYKLRGYSIEQLYDSTGVMDYIVYSGRYHINSVQ